MGNWFNWFGRLLGTGCACLAADCGLIALWLGYLAICVVNTGFDLGAIVGALMRSQAMGNFALQRCLPFIVDCLYVIIYGVLL